MSHRSAGPEAHGTIPPVKRLPLAVAVGALLVAVAGSALGWGAPSAAPSPSASAGVALGNRSPAPASIEPTASGPARPSDAGGSATPAPSPSASAAPAAVLADVPIVPVAQFRTTVQSIGRDDVRAALAGSGGTFQGLELIADEADAILAGLKVDRPAGDAGLVLAPDAATLTKDLAKNRKRLGVLRADDVGSGVRALGWGGKSLFGVDRGHGRRV